MTNEIKTNVQILPMQAIMKALNIDEKTLLNYQEKIEIKPTKINDNYYYSLDDFEKLKLMIA